MAGVTCYSIQTLSIYPKEHCLYSGIKLLVFTATRKHRGADRVRKGSSLQWSVRVGQSLLYQKVFSLHFTLHYFTPVSTLRPTGHKHSICTSETTTKIVSIVAPHNQWVCAGHSCHTSSEEKITIVIVETRTHTDRSMANLSHCLKKDKRLVNRTK